MAGIIRAFKYRPFTATAVFAGSFLASGAIVIAVLVVIDPYGIH